LSTAFIRVTFEVGPDRNCLGNKERQETDSPFLVIGSLLVWVVEPAGNRREGGSTLAVRSSRGDARTRRRARGRGREREETLRKRKGERRNSRRREEKCESDEVEDEGRRSCSLGVARVHLIYRTLRNVEGTTPKLNHYPSEALALQWALRPRVASCDAPVLRPYELRRVPTMLRCFSTMLRRIFTML